MHGVDAIIVCWLGQFEASIMASNQQPNSNKSSSSSSVYESSGGFQNFVHSYGGRMWNDADVQEAKAISAAMQHHDAHQAKTSSGTSASSNSSSNSSSNPK